MGRLRNVKMVDLPIKRQQVPKKAINAYRATRLWNQVVNGFKRLMPLGTHRVRFHSYDNCFKRQDAQTWLVDFIKDTQLLLPISVEKSAILLDKFVDMKIIEQVCCVKGWLRSPTILYKFTGVNEYRVEKLRTLRYYSRTPVKGTPEADLKLPNTPIRTAVRTPLVPTPLYVKGKENVMIYAKSPRVANLKRSRQDVICTPCKTRSIKRNMVLSSTPKQKQQFTLDNITQESPYVRALKSIHRPQNIAARMSNRSVKRIGNKGPIKKDLTSKKKNTVIEGILDEFDELIAAIDNKLKT